MQKNISIRLIVPVVAVLIVLPVNGSVKHLPSNREVLVSTAVLSGSPLPAPNPPGFSIVSLSGSPLPAANPLDVLSASGSLLSGPNSPDYSALTASGSPLPAPNPPGLIA